MGCYNISSLIKIMQEGLAETQENTGRMLLYPVAMQAQVDITGKMITNLVKRNNDVHSDIKNALTRPDVIVKAEAAIIRDLVPKLNKLLIDDTCIRIIGLMRSDNSVPQAVVYRMENHYRDGRINEFFTHAILYALSRDNLSHEQEIKEKDLFFIEEANFTCPLSGTKLYKRIKGETVRRYRIVHIYPDDLPRSKQAAFDKIQPIPANPDSGDNLIALCPDCAEAYLLNPTAEEYANLLQRKKEIVRIHKGKMAVSETRLEREIEDIVSAICKIGSSTQLKSFTSVVKVKEKIRPEFYALQQEMEDRVVKYYPFIEEKFSLLDGTSGVSFNVIRAEINSAYEQYEAAGMNQEEICDALSDWILSSIGIGSGYKTAGNIVVAFFIQLCDVFHPFVKNN